MKPVIIATLSLALVSASTKGQFTVVGGAPTQLWQLSTLEIAGPKYVNEAWGSFTLWNLDLTIYASATAPALSPPFQAMGITYITESLFDTDPTTLEYCQQYSDTSGNGGPTALGFRILSQDGTILFDQFPGSLGSRAGGDDVTSSSAIFNTTEGTFMIVVGVGGSTVYLLPGHLPCLDCNGVALMTPSGDGSTGGSEELTVFPNPTTGEATVQYTLPPGTSRAALVFFSANGDLVQRIPVHGSGSKTITIADMAAGTYLYQLETDQGVIGAKRLVIVR